MGVLYGCILAIRQVDIKRLIAYSSVSHMGFAIIALFSSSAEGLHSSIYSMVAHGCIASCLFAMAGIIYDRFHSRTTMYYKGLVVCMPIAASFFIIAVLGNVSTPGFLNFLGELLAFFSSLFSKLGY